MKSSDTMEIDFGILSMEESISHSILNENKTKPFRIIICGDSGIGKTSLVKALTNMIDMQNKEIVLEPIEYYNSSSNLYVIDTCGYGAILRADVVFNHVKSFIERQFEETNKIFNVDFKDNEKLKYILNQSNTVFTHVDVCLYIITGRIKPVDIEYMKSMNELVNIIPVIIQNDISIRKEILAEQKAEILKLMKQNNISTDYLNMEHNLPLVLDWSNKSKSFHGLIALKQFLVQHNYFNLKTNTTQKYIAWKQQRVVNNSMLTNSSSGGSSSTSSGGTTLTLSKTNNLNSIRISQYISNRRHNFEKELLLQEKKLKQEFEIISKEKRVEILLKEFNRLLLEDSTNKLSILRLIEQQQHNQQNLVQNSITYHYYQYYWIPLSILFFILLYFKTFI